MAETIVNVIVTGLAFCRPITATDRPPRGELQILFLHPDPQHNVKLKITKMIGADPPVTIAEETLPNPTPADPVRSQLRISADTEVRSDRPIGSSKVDLVDLFQLHRDSHNPVSMRLKPPPVIDRSYLTIPSANYYTKSLTDLNHEFWVYNKRSIPNSKTLITGFRKPIGREIGVDFQIPMQKELHLDLIRPTAKNYPLPTIADVTYTITFDNTCHEHTCGNDFAYYYEVLESGEIEIEEFPLRRAITGGGQSLEAACNPAFGDPSCNLENYYLNGACS